MISKLLFLYIIFPVVLPNSLRSFSLPVFVLVGFLSLLMSFRCLDVKAAILYLSGVLVTLFYFYFGLDDAVANSTYWILFVYIFSPFFWIYIWIYIFKIWNEKEFVFNLKFLTILSCITVYIFIYLFINKGAESVSLFIEESNLEFKGGNIALTMHVFGSLIFLVAGFFAAPELFDRKLRFPILIFMAITVFVSGRSALILAMIIGIGVSFFRVKKIEKFYYLLSAIFLLFIINISLSITYQFSDDGFSVDINKIFSNFIEKINDGGGEERQLQFEALWDGIYNNYFMGVGHGVPAFVVRNDDSPWKYELLGLSTIYHVGLFGFLVYIAPIILVYAKFFKMKKMNGATSLDVFVITGMTSILIASNTNPYLVSFDFQWMLVMPLIYFFRKKK